MGKILYICQIKTKPDSFILKPKERIIILSVLYFSILNKRYFGVKERA